MAKTAASLQNYRLPPPSPSIQFQLQSEQKEIRLIFIIIIMPTRRLGFSLLYFFAFSDWGRQEKNTINIMRFSPRERDSFTDAHASVTPS